MLFSHIVIIIDSTAPASSRHSSACLISVYLSFFVVHISLLFFYVFFLDLCFSFWFLILRLTHTSYAEQTLFIIRISLRSDPTYIGIGSQIGYTLRDISTYICTLPKIDFLSSLVFLLLFNSCFAFVLFHLLKIIITE